MNLVAPVGIKVFVNDAACIRDELKQFRFPKSRKKRIRNKWSKNMNNYRLEKVHKVLVTSQGIFVSQKTYEQLKQQPTA